ncbi:ATP-binding protein [Chryseobacterium balustinum]|nr:ATP-binding protein [Chryseobacterium balustinum]
MTNKLFLYANENKVVGTNGVFAMGFELELIEKYAMGEEDYEAVDQLWNRALKDMPQGSIFLKQDVFTEQNLNTGSYKEENYLQKATKEYFNDKPFLSHQCFVFFVLPPGNILNTNITNPFKRLNRKVFESFDDRINQFVTTVEQIVNFLNTGKINAGKAFKLISFSENEMLQHYDFYFNNFQAEYTSDRILKDDYLQIGNKKLSVLSTKDEEKMPESFKDLYVDKNFSTPKFKFFQNIGDLFGFELNFDHVYNQIICFEDNQKELSKLRNRLDLLKKSSSFDPNNKANAKKLTILTDQIADDIDSERIIKGHFNIIFSAENEVDLKARRNLIIEKFKSVDIKPRQPIGNFLNSIFTNSFYLFAHCLSEKQLFYGNLSTATLFLNNCSHYKNDEKGILFNSRIGNVPVLVDQWDEEKRYMNARNFMIFAPTGGGKSFTANHILRHAFEENARIVIIDLGESYRKFSALYPKESVFVRYKEGESIGINPFDLQGDTLSSQKTFELAEIVLTHYKRDSTASENEKTALRKIIEAYYRSGIENASLLNFVAAVRDTKNHILNDLNIQTDFFNIEEFLFAMSEFEKGGIYDFLYKTEDNSDLQRIKDKKLIVFELDEVKDNQLLLSIMLQLVSSVIQETIWKDKSTKGYILFDEVAKQFKFKGVFEKIEYFYQAGRKQNASIGIILQSISQLPDEGEKGQIAKTIIENTQVVYVLNAKDYRALQTRFGMSEHAYHQMSSLSSKFEGNEKYSEVFIMRGNHHQVYRLEVPEKVFWAYQTEGAKNEELMKIYSATQNMETAINQYIQSQN